MEKCMPIKVRYSEAEITLAKQLFSDAKTNGTLKSPRGLIAVALSNGFRHSVSQAITYTDYLRDARKQLSQNGRHC